ncbi:MAG: CHRD domain-containing protein [Saprospiraceae bacterium]
MKSISLTSITKLTSLLLLSLSSSLTAQSGQLMFAAHLNGAQEVPAVTTSGEGLITVLIGADRKTMQIQGVVSNLSGPVTAAHLHAGLPGVSGGVVLDLNAIRTGNKFAGEVGVSPTLLRQLLTTGIYVNVHTAMNPSGEIRGQLIPETDLHFGCVLTGLNEVPQVITTATGMGGVQITLGHNKVQYRFVVNGLSGAITAAHIHEGAIGAAGPVVAGLGFSGNTLIGELPTSSLPADFVTKLLAGAYYVNVHTAANPGGEVRGQLSFLSYLSGFALLNGDQETPPVTTNAIGIGGVSVVPGLDSLVYFVQVTGLSGPATAAHVHRGAGGVAGGVVFGLTAVPLATGLYTATVALDSARISDLIKGDWYFNVHTAANPSGEIRGQIQSNLRKSYAFELCGAQEVPSTNSTGYGAGMVSIDQGNLTARYKLSVNNLSGPATAAHIHTGATGATGGVLFGLTTPAPYSEGAIAITGINATLIANAGTYMNVHTAANPGGEIRGQVIRGLACAGASAVFDPIVADVRVFPNPATEMLKIQVDSREAFEGLLQVSDLSGRLLISQNVATTGSGLQEWSLPVTELSDGLYFLRLTREGKNVLVYRVVKM